MQGFSARWTQDGRRATGAAMGSQSDEHEHQSAVEFARLQAERERTLGVDPTDAAARFLSDAQAGRTYRALDSSTAPWRNKRPTHAQLSLLRQLGLNPFSVRTRGEAADTIARHRRKRATD